MTWVLSKVLSDKVFNVTKLDFARKIAVLMDDPERRRVMGDIGQQRVRTELAWSHQEKHLLKVYQALSV